MESMEQIKCFEDLKKALSSLKFYHLNCEIVEDEEKSWIRFIPEDDFIGMTLLSQVVDLSRIHPGLYFLVEEDVLKDKPVLLVYSKSTI